MYKKIIVAYRLIRIGRGVGCLPKWGGRGTSKKRASIFQKGQNIDLFPYIGPRKAM